MKTSLWWAVPHNGSYTLVKGGDRPTGALLARLESPIRKGQHRAKGSDFERKVAKVLNDWLFKGEPVLRRTPLSGGWSKDMGDIACDPQTLGDRVQPRLYVECKNQNAIDLNTLMTWALTGEGPKFYREWLGGVAVARGQRLGLLIMKGAQTDPWAIALTCRHRDPGIHRVTGGVCEGGYAIRGAPVAAHDGVLFPFNSIFTVGDKAREEVLGS